VVKKLAAERTLMIFSVGTETFIVRESQLNPKCIRENDGINLDFS